MNWVRHIRAFVITTSLFGWGCSGSDLNGLGNGQEAGTDDPSEAELDILVPSSNVISPSSASRMSSNNYQLTVSLGLHGVAGTTSSSKHYLRIMPPTGP